MKISSHQTRRAFLKSTAVASLPLFLPGAQAEEAPRFTLGIQEYTFHRWIRAGKLTHLDYPVFCRDKFGIKNIEYWSGPFAGKHKDQKHLTELKKRSIGEGLKNILILVDMRPRLDSPKKEVRQQSIDAHMDWVETARALECGAIRVNCHSGGDPTENMKNAADGLRGLCEKSKQSGIKIIVENHGGNSANGEWIASVMKEVSLDNCGALPDFGTFKQNDPYKGLEAMLPWAHVLCAKSHNFDADGNETGVDYFKMLKIATASKFSGCISIEYEGSKIGPIEGVNKTRALLEKAIAKAKG
jgi:L-ribulose-5-phosphate 3-epimerase